MQNVERRLLHFVSTIRAVTAWPRRAEDEAMLVVAVLTHEDALNGVGYSGSCPERETVRQFGARFILTSAGKRELPTVTGRPLCLEPHFAECFRCLTPAGWRQLRRPA